MKSKDRKQLVYNQSVAPGKNLVKFIYEAEVLYKQLFYNRYNNCHCRSPFIFLFNDISLSIRCSVQAVRLSELVEKVAVGRAAVEIVAV